MNKKQNGATAIEFALSLSVLLTFLLGIVDFGRMLFTWSAANEAARVGARYAVVCDNMNNEAQVLARMRGLLPQITEIDIDWYAEEGPTCTPSTCDGVTVTIVGLDYQWISPIGLAASVAPIRMPTFSTYLPREMMRQDPNSDVLCST